jgi:hypothetical protein
VDGFLRTICRAFREIRRGGDGVDGLLREAAKRIEQEVGLRMQLRSDLRNLAARLGLDRAGLVDRALAYLFFERGGRLESICDGQRTISDAHARNRVLKIVRQRALRELPKPLPSDIPRLRLVARRAGGPRFAGQGAEHVAAEIEEAMSEDQRLVFLAYTMDRLLRDSPKERGGPTFRSAAKDLQCRTGRPFKIARVRAIHVSVVELLADHLVANDAALSFRAMAILGARLLGKETGDED